MERNQLIAKRLLIGLISLALSSCNNQELQKLKSENINLTSQNDSLKNIVSYYEQKEVANNKRQELTSKYTNQSAIETFKNHVNFYCKNCDYKDFRVNKYSDYIFDISMTKRSNAEHVMHDWIGVVVRLTFQSNGKFTIQNLQGTYDFGCQ
jgi:hypothetical protein